MTIKVLLAVTNLPLMVLLALWLRTQSLPWPGAEEWEKIVTHTALAILVFFWYNVIAYGLLKRLGVISKEDVF